MQISIGDSNKHRLDEIMRQRADHRRRQEGDQDAQHEAPRAGIRRQIDQNFQELCRVDRKDRQDRAELDQNLESLAGRLKAEKVAGEQNVAGRGDRQEFCEPLQQAEQKRFDDRLVFHSSLV